MTENGKNCESLACLVLLVFVLLLAAVIVFFGGVCLLNVIEGTKHPILFLAVVLISLILISFVIGKCQEIRQNYASEWLVVSIAVFTVIVGAMICYRGGCEYFIIPLFGIIALIIPIILSISSDYNVGSKLDSGEIRKSIVISLTILYIIFLAMSFQESLTSSENDGVYHTIVNVTREGNTTIIDVNTTSEDEFQVNASDAVVQINRKSSRNGAGEVEGAGAILLTSDNRTEIPTDAINDFTKNFLWVYALIISFYFGSRILENRSDKNKVDAYISDLIDKEKCKFDPLEIIKMRYSLGDIGSREFTKMMGDFEKLAKQGEQDPNA
ncbi:MAG TPA: hypothetical protein PLM24_06420, partial [Methanothrix sp.]|nr:hypothetical protein [Methanothrix sp.]HPR66755.1 hypothetical protein [Methanothrix sp.]